MEILNVSKIKNGNGFLSYDLREEFNNLNLLENDIVINTAYTDYGGDFFDKVLIAYFKEKYPDNILSEFTCYNGENAVIYGNIVNDFLKEYENYFLGFEDIENFYFEMENNLYHEDFEHFLNDIKNDYFFDYDTVLCYLMENESGQHDLLPNMIDFSYERLITKLIKENVIFESSLLKLFNDNYYNINIAMYYINCYENNTLNQININEETLAIFKEYEENNL